MLDSDSFITLLILVLGLGLERPVLSRAPTGRVREGCSRRGPGLEVNVYERPNGCLAKDAPGRAGPTADRQLSAGTSSAA